MNPNCSGNRRN